MLTNVTYGMCVKEIKQPGSEGQIQMASFYLENAHTQTERTRL